MDQENVLPGLTSLSFKPLPVLVISGQLLTVNHQQIFVLRSYEVK